MILHQFKSGEFFFSNDSSLRSCSRYIPNQPGVYIIWGYRNDEWILVYYGKAGMSKGGRLYKQGVYDRLNNTHGNMPRSQYLKMIINEFGIEKLKIKWVVTWDETNNVNPCDVEDAFYNFKPSLLNKRRGRSRKE